MYTLHIALYEHYVKYLTKYQHGFVKRGSVLRNMLAFLQIIFESRDKKSKNELIAFDKDFMKAFNKVP